MLQAMMYYSLKVPQNVGVLVEMTFASGVIKCALRTPHPDIANLVFEAFERILA